MPHWVEVSFRQCLPPDYFLGQLYIVFHLLFFSVRRRAARAYLLPFAMRLANRRCGNLRIAHGAATEDEASNEVAALFWFLLDGIVFISFERRGFFLLFLLFFFFFGFSSGLR